MSERLPAGIEVSALIRRVQAEGGFASVLHKGDADRGTISLLVAERGETRAVLERRMPAATQGATSTRPSERSCW